MLIVGLEPTRLSTVVLEATASAISPYEHTTSSLVSYSGLPSCYFNLIENLSIISNLIADYEVPFRVASGLTSMLRTRTFGRLS